MSVTFGIAGHQAVVELTNTQIIALPTTPIVIIPAPGTGKAIKFRYGAISNGSLASPSIITPYTNIDAAASIYFRCHPYDVSCYSRIDGVGGDGVSLESLITDNLGGVAIQLDSMQNDQYTQYSLIENIEVTIKVDNGGAGIFTGGNALNKLLVAVVYDIFNLHNGLFE